MFEPLDPTIAQDDDVEAHAALAQFAVSSSTQLPALPDIPPFSEAANAPDFEAVSWHMMFAPAATPPDIVARLHDEMKKVMADPELRKKISDLGLISVETPSVNGIKTYIKSEQEKWGSLVRKLGLEATQ
jgi:tripartite-type tricarboxylate transporter receptor subunit TctC